MKDWVLNEREWEALECLYKGWWVSSDMIPALIEKDLAWYRVLSQGVQILEISTRGVQLIKQRMEAQS